MVLRTYNMRIQEFVKSIEGVSNCVWNYDNFQLQVFVKESYWNTRDFIVGKIFNHLNPNLLANVEKIEFVMI